MYFANMAKRWTIFRIDLDELMMNGRIITKLENGKKVTSEPSVVQLNGKYIFAYYLFLLIGSIILWLI